MKKEYLEFITSYDYTAFNYAYFYNDIVNENPDFKTFVEVGSFLGYSISHLANLLRNRSDVRITAADLWQATPEMAERHQQIRDVLNECEDILYDLYQTKLELSEARYLIKDIRGDSADSAKHFADASIDFCYIDADHSYQSVKKDVYAWLPKIKNNGIIAGHDYDQDGVAQAVHEVIGEDKIEKIKHHIWSYRVC